MMLIEIHFCLVLYGNNGGREKDKYIKVIFYLTKLNMVLFPYMREEV